MGSRIEGGGTLKISELSTLLKRGKSPKYGTSTIQVIKSGQARGYEKFDFSEKVFVKEDFILDERKLQKGDLLINSTGVGTAGRVTLFNLDGDFVADNHITILRPNEKLNPKFGLYSFVHLGFKTLEKMANGASGQIELSIETIKNITFKVPSLTKQQELVAEIESYETEIAKLEALITQSASKKQAILSKYL